jgi:O-antigen/teichoic acid export membrane protein
VVVNAVVTIGVMAEVARLARRDKAGQATTMRALSGYAARVYPASITGYFNYRADTYIIQAVSASKTAADHALGLYGIAVTMAEIVFYVPESVSSMFLPRVAAGSHEDSNAMIGRVSRLTMLASVALALMLIPAAFIGIHLVLPKYNDCLPAFVAILPGVVSLSLSKVMTSYVAGRGRPGPISVAAAITLVVNVGFNFLLIPQFGIVGASLASVASYSVMAAMMVVLASRMSGQSVACLCIPRPADFRVLATGSMALARKAATRGRAAATRGAG